MPTLLSTLLHDNGIYLQELQREELQREEPRSSPAPDVPWADPGVFCVDQSGAHRIVAETRMTTLTWTFENEEACTKMRVPRATTWTSPCLGRPVICGYPVTAVPVVTSINRPHQARTSSIRHPDGGREP